MDTNDKFQKNDLVFYFIDEDIVIEKIVKVNKLYYLTSIVYGNNTNIKSKFLWKMPFDISCKKLDMLQAKFYGLI